MNTIELKGLTKHYNDFTLDSISLTLPGGCIMGLIGENGAGKSTMIRLLLGLSQPDSGSISILGYEGKDLYLAKDDIGFVMDCIGFDKGFKLRHVDSIMRSAYRSWNSEEFFSLAERFKVPDNKKISKMSQGTRMKLSIAAALSHNARLLILDEATNGLDPVARDEVTDILYDFTKDEEHSVLISSHIVSDLEKMCDYIAFLHMGKLFLCDEKAIIGKRVNKYGADVIIYRKAAPKNFKISSIDIESLFIFMVKEDDE